MTTPTWHAAGPEAGSSALERAPTFAETDGRGIRDLLPEFLEALGDAVLVVDHDRRVVAANQRFVDAFGRRRVDLLDSICTDAAHDPVAAPDGERCAPCQVFEQGRPVRRLQILHDAGGATRRFDVAFVPIHGVDGAVSHVAGVWRDTTERNRLEVQISHGERLASVGILAAGVAHEINNPLASMLAIAESLDRWLGRGRFGPDDRAEAVESVTMLKQEIERARETTEKLMLLGRSYDTAPGWVDVNQAVRDTLVLLRYEMRKRDIEAQSELDASLPPVWAREAGIRGVCMNLALNAVQAMATGGTLTITTARSGERALLRVADTGPGIAPEHLERIWDPFFTTKPVGQGTGLGLSITHRIVTRHGGRVMVTSEPGHGARFDVEIPFHGTGGET